MQDKLRALVRLAEIDNSARDTDEQLNGIPEELEERRAAVQSLEALVGGQRTQLEEAKALIAQQEADIKTRNDMLAKAPSGPSVIALRSGSAPVQARTTCAPRAASAGVEQTETSNSACSPAQACARAGVRL